MDPPGVGESAGLPEFLAAVPALQVVGSIYRVDLDPRAGTVPLVGLLVRCHTLETTEVRPGEPSEPRFGQT